MHLRGSTLHSLAKSTSPLVAKSKDEPSSLSYLTIVSKGKGFNA